MIDVNVEWGDARHSHDYCDYIMKQKRDFKERAKEDMAELTMLVMIF